MSLLQELHEENTYMLKDLGITDKEEERALATLELTLSDVLYDKDCYEVFKDYIAISKTASSLLENNINEIFIDLQNERGITDGFIDPYDAIYLDDLRDMMSELIAKVITYEKLSTEKEND